MPERKTLKNRLHLDITVSGGRSAPIEVRRQRVDAEASRRAGLGAALVRVLYEEGLDHYAVAMTDPEGNEFDINWRTAAASAARRRLPPGSADPPAGSGEDRPRADHDR